jgi:hypothetical protein
MPIPVLASWIRISDCIWKQRYIRDENWEKEEFHPVSSGGRQLQPRGGDETSRKRRVM